MSRSGEKSLYLAPQTGGWDTDPSADGSGYLSVPIEDLSELAPGIEILATAAQDGRMTTKANEPGAPSLVEISGRIPLWGLGTAAGDAGSPPAVDVLDTVLTHILETVATRDGEGVGVGSTASNLILDTDVADVGDLIAYHLGSGSTRAQWVYVTADNGAGDYDVAPNMSPAAADAGIAYGARQWTPPVTGFVGGDVLSLVYVDSDIGTYRLPNVRITSAAINGEVGERLFLDVTYAADSAVLDAAKTSLPAALQTPPVTTVKALGSPIAFDGTLYDAASFSFDFGITAAPVKGVSSLTGRSGHENIMLAPTLTFNPLRTNAIRNLQRAASQGPALLQLGGGVLSGTVLNTLALYMGNAQVVEAGPEDDDGHARQSIKLMATDPGAAGIFLRAARS